MLSSQVLQEAISILDQRTDLDVPTKYVLLASFLLYFKSPLKSEKWNTFPTRILRREVSVQQGLYSTDVDKNPEFWTSSSVPIKVKKEVQDHLFSALWPMRDALARKNYFSAPQSLIAIPDPATPTRDATLFPVEYLKKQVDQGNYVNELTGHPLSWMVVEQVRSPSASSSGPASASTRHRTVQATLVQKLVQTEIDQLRAFHETCAVCRKKTRQFKTLHNYQTIYFCSLNCLSAWEPA